MERVRCALLPRGRVVDALQCAGMTNAGTRCKKMVRGDAVRGAVDADVFCHHHEKKMHEPSGFYDRKAGEFVKFDGALLGFGYL